MFFRPVPLRSLGSLAALVTFVSLLFCHDCSHIHRFVGKVNSAPAEPL
jgi:hypothetical protein